MNEAAIIKAIMACMGSLGLAMVYNVKRKHLLLAAAGGLIGWLIYARVVAVTGRIFFPSLCASIFAELYGEVLARIRRCPANIYVITTLIPLIPGGSLYYMMSSMIQKQWAVGRQYGMELLAYLLGLSIGICFVSAILNMGLKLRRRNKEGSPCAEEKERPSVRD